MEVTGRLADRADGAGPVWVSAQIPAELRAAATEQAERDGDSRSELIRRALLQYLTAAGGESRERQ